MDTFDELMRWRRWTILLAVPLGVLLSWVGWRAWPSSGAVGLLVTLLAWSVAAPLFLVRSELPGTSSPSIVAWWLLGLGPLVGLAVARVLSP